MKDIIELAREVDATPYTNRHYPDKPTYTFTVEKLERFAAIVRAAALEEAAEVCRELDNEGNTDAYAAAAGFCAERIEALKEKT